MKILMLSVVVLLAAIGVATGEPAAIGDRPGGLLACEDLPGEAMRAQPVCRQFHYDYTHIMVRSQTPQSVFVGGIEPYAGGSFLTGLRLLDVAGNETDARRAVAVELKTRARLGAPAGRVDLCLADGRPERLRAAGPVRWAGEFAYYSTDSQGLRQAALTGGTVLEAPEVTLAAAARERVGRVTQANYLKKTLSIDAVWPASSGGRAFEIGRPEHLTNYHAGTVVAGAGGTTITLNQGADYYRSPIRAVDGAAREVRCALGPALGRTRGLDRNWTASNEQMTKFWRADLKSADTFVLRGGPVAEAEFAPEGVLRLWDTASAIRFA